MNLEFTHLNPFTIKIMMRFDVALLLLSLSFLSLWATDLIRWCLNARTHREEADICSHTYRIYYMRNHLIQRHRIILIIQKKLASLDNIHSDVCRSCCCFYNFKLNCGILSFFFFIFLVLSWWPAAIFVFSLFICVNNKLVMMYLKW